eukprot:gene9649-1853_t
MRFLNIGVLLLFCIVFVEAKIDCDKKAKHVAFYRDCFTPNCTRKLEEACICPLDKMNNNCKEVRNFECSVDLIQPTLDCEKLEVVGGKEISGDPICIKQNMSSTLDIKHNINCYFIENGMNYTHLPQDKNYTDLRTGVYYPKFKDIMNSFNYFVNVDNGKFTLTSKFGNKLRFKVVNFERFSDSSQTREITLEKEHFLKILSFENRLVFKNITESFYAGNRLYIEVGFPTYPTGMKQLHWNRFHIDFTDRYFPPVFHQVLLL